MENCILLLENQKFAVVDIETTGTNIKEGARIIQIGIVIVQNNKIIQTFATNVNPKMLIPEGVIQLTQISNEDVKNAPKFEDVAKTIWNLIKDTIFVAHNINFDLPFLMSEFERVGFEKISIGGIDTVPLSQILYPTAPGYRLMDLSHYLKISHLQPHRADSDAKATAKLFIDLWDETQKLPVDTLKIIEKFAKILPRQTADFFTMAIEQNNNKTINNNLIKKEKLIFTNITKLKNNKTKDYKFPITQNGKIEAYNKIFRLKVSYYRKN